MINLEEILNHITDTEWIKEKIVSKISPTSFTILNREYFYYKHGDRDEFSENDTRSGWSEIGCCLGQFNSDEPLPTGFSEPHKEIEGGVTTTRSKIDIYLFNDGEIGFVQSTTYSWEDGRSISPCGYLLPHGASGFHIFTKCMIFNKKNIQPYFKTIGRALSEKLEK